MPTRWFERQRRFCPGSSGSNLPDPALAHADKAGDALLQKCFEAETNATTLEADFTHQHKENGQTRVQTGMLQLKKPNLAHIVVNSSKGQGSNVVINSDGQKFVTYTYADNAYATEIADIAGSNVARNNINETKIFFFPDYLNRLRFGAAGATDHGSGDGRQCRVQNAGTDRPAAKGEIVRRQ